jgi:hypothetical protein
MNPPPSLRSLTVILVLVAFLLCAVRPAHACGPFAREAIFTFTKHPDIPLDAFARGELGVLQDRYARSYLFVAYRYMNGLSFNSTEQQALMGMWQERLSFDWENTAEGGKAIWLAARKKVKSAGADPSIEIYRTSGKEDYDFFVNCPEVAFETAAQTLEARIRQFGAESAEVKGWLEAQDKVFSNCASGETIPEPSGATAPLLRADREYQIAAAKFYAMKFDEAKLDFEKIASDAASPWHETARYLVARSLIRKASLGDPALRQETLRQAETELQRTLGEIKQGALHTSAARLLNLVKLRLRPEERLRELSQSLMKREPNTDLKQELWDYTVILDKYLGDEDEPVDESVKKNLDKVIEDDLSDWLRTFQSGEKSSIEHALEKWRKTDSQVWLVAALSKVYAAHEARSDLIAAADRIAPNQPAFATASYHVIRLLLEAGDRAGARSRLDEILNRTQPALPPSALNQFLHQRMLVSTTLEEFLKYAQRHPAAFSWGEDGRELPITAKDLNEDDELKQLVGQTLFDLDAARIMNEQFPLSLLLEAARSRVLPEHLRRRIALAAWTRAVLLNDTGAGKALAPILSRSAPEMRALLNEYMDATTDAAKQAVALYALLKFPGTRPFITPGVGRFTPLNERDIYRDNWWCEQAPGSYVPVDEGQSAGDTTANSQASGMATPLAPDFLSTAQREAGKRERAALLSLGSGPNYLAREAVDWGNRMPNNPRIPEALHLAVMATRYSCVDEKTGPLSRAAWQLLHTRYKNSVWAKKTPYWFKGY